MAKFYKKGNSQRTLKRFIHTQTRKAVTATAGVQAIIESPIGAYKVDNIDKWWFFNPANPNNYLLTDIDENGNDFYVFEIKEPRLLNRLRGTGIFQNLQRIIQVPPNAQNEDNRLMPAKESQVGKVQHFPTWFFCETCERFKTIEEWWNGWEDVLRNDEKVNDPDKIRARFIFDTKLSGRPNCFCCYKDSLEGKKKRKFHKLEQVRFVFVSPDGDIKDIGWTKWITAQRLGSDGTDEDSEGIEKGRYVLGKEPCCPNPSLLYVRSTKLSDLAGITIQCKNCKRRKTLAGFFNLRKRKGNITDSKQNTYPVFFKPLIRTSNSIYYPIVMSSLFIPQPVINLSHDQKSAIRLLSTAGNSPEKISDVIKISLQEVQQVLGEGVYLSETEFRKNEYHYLLNEYKYLLNTSNFTSDEKDLILEEIPLNDELKNYGFEKIIKIKRLKLTSVQTGYTRLSPMDRDIFSNSKEDKFIRFDNKDIPLKSRFTVAKPNETEYLMGVENFGEGIFIKWNDEGVKTFSAEFLKNEKCKAEVTSLYQRVQQNEMISKDKFADTTHLVKTLLIHSFSHLIIKELEFLCGYPSSSVAERIYCDSDTMNGLLIYTIAGSEGSFGGLIKQAESDNFSKILSSALFRATDCSSDPICYESDGQGVGGLNYAACFSCLLISETSCEEFNSFLDRRILIDKDNGFFK